MEADRLQTGRRVRSSNPRW